MNSKYNLMKALLILLLIPALGSAQIPTLSDTLTGSLSNGVIHFHWTSTNDLGAKEYAVVQVRPDGTLRYASNFITPLNNGGSADYTTDVPLDNNVRNAAFTGLILLLGFGVLLGFGRKLLIPALTCLVMVVSCSKSESTPSIQGTPPGGTVVSNSTRGTFRLQVIQANGQIWNYTYLVTITYP
jgi:hypothetical protein